MIQISKHLTFEECVKSETADKLGIKNDNPNLSVIDNMKLLANKVYEPIIDHFNVKIYVPSVFRCLQLNQAVKGSITSQHCSGQAMDMDNDGSKVTNAIIFHWIKDNLEFDQLIWEGGTKTKPDWVHVSYVKGKNRKQVLRAIKVKGRMHYENF